MGYLPELHSKEFLLTHLDELIFLAKNSIEFAQSSLCQDKEILAVKDPRRSNETIAHKLAKYQSNWCLTPIAESIDVLKICDDHGNSVAHMLASYQQEWIKTEASKNHEILELRTLIDHTVAHNLAEFNEGWFGSLASNDINILSLRNYVGLTVAHSLAYRNERWAKSEYSQNENLLKLADTDGNTVAHLLAKSQSDWLFTDAANRFEILSLRNKRGTTVAHNIADTTLYNKAMVSIDVLELKDDDDETVAAKLVKNKSAIIHDLSLSKRLLTIDDDGQLLAESIFRSYGKESGFTVTSIAMKLISQGAAYKHSRPVYVKVPNELIAHTVEILNTTTNPMVSIKIAKALYSTIAHFSAVTAKLGDQKNSNLQLSLMETALSQAEEILVGLLDEHAEIIDIDSSSEIEPFCEPADIIAKRAIAKRKLSTIGNLAELGQDLSSDQLPIRNLY